MSSGPARGPLMDAGDQGRPPSSPLRRSPESSRKTRQVELSGSTFATRWASRAAATCQTPARTPRNGVVAGCHVACMAELIAGTLGRRELMGIALGWSRKRRTLTAYALPF